jgi:hypothetical protein
LKTVEQKIANSELGINSGTWRLGRKPLNWFNKKCKF